MNKIYEIKAICTNINCRYNIHMGYMDERENISFVKFPNSIYDGECPKCKSQINIRIFDVEGVNK